MPYQSPFSIRYGSEEMRSLWSEVSKRRAWRRIWLAVAQAQAGADLITAEQLMDIQDHLEEIDLKRALEIESEIGHDLMAELRTFSEQCPVGGGVLHWGLTSADVQDNADVIRQKAGLAILLKELKTLLLAFAERIEETAHLPIMGYTHLQPAEPTTMGYRLSLYAQDLLSHHQDVLALHRRLRGKGIRGAVGTSGPFKDMLEKTDRSPDEMEKAILGRLGLQPHPITSQTYPRLQDFTLVAHLAGISASLHKFGLDLRIMQSPGIGGVKEPFGESQVGSSAMPFKRNPVMSEKICSLARQVAAFLDVAWENAASTMLERSLDDSANRRSMIPESFLATDELLRTATKVITGLEWDREQIQRQLEHFGPFAAQERVLTALVGQGADRGEMHERLRLHAQSAWESIRQGDENPLADLIASDTSFLQYLQPAKILQLMEASEYTGLASERAEQFASELRAQLAEPAKK